MKIKINQTKNYLKLFKFSLSVGLFLFFYLLISSCGGKNENTVEGAGATFPYPFYSQIFDRYHQDTQVKVNYQSIGSGGGIKQITEKTVDFGATDAFVKDKELSEINNKNENNLLHIPIVLGGVSITYNVAGLPSLNLDGDTLAGIFSGKITTWNDPAIMALNSERNLPTADIIVIRRSDGSGTTSALSSFLAHINADWARGVGVGKSLNWFNGSIGAKGNEGVTGQLQNTPNSITYVSLNYAIENDLPVVAVKNSFGNFIQPTVESVSLSANTDIPSDTRIDLTVLEGDPDGYPISTFTWIVFYQEQKYDNRTQAQAEQLKALLIWMLGPDAQSEAAPLHYAPLPEIAVMKAQAVIDSITYGGLKL